MKPPPTGLVIAALGVMIIVAGLAFLPDEVLLGPVGIILILGGLAMAEKGASA